MTEGTKSITALAIFRLPIGGTCWAHCCDNLHDGTCTIRNNNHNNYSINFDEKTKKKPKKEAGWRKTRMGVKCERELAKKGLKWQESYSTSPHPLSWSVVAAISAGLCGKHTLSKAPNLQDCLWDKITPRQIIWTKLLHSWFSNKIYSTSSSCHLFVPPSLLTSRENSTLSISKWYTARLARARAQSSPENKRRQLQRQSTFSQKLIHSTKPCLSLFGF